MITKIQEFITDKNDKKYQFIINWLNKYLRFSEDIKYIQINDDYSINSNRYLRLFSKDTNKLSKSIDVKFNKVKYGFIIGTSILNSLYNSPIWVGINYFCYDCELNNLKGIADFINGYLFFHQNPLTLLTGLNFKFKYEFGDSTIEWLTGIEQQHLIKDLLDENILWYDKFKEYMNDDLKEEFNWYKNTKSLLKE